MQIRSQKVKDFFNETGNYLKNNLVIDLRSRLISENLPNPKNKSILDIGCGNGELTLPYIKNNKITFIDLSDKMLEIVKAKIPVEYNRNAKFLNIDIDKLDSTDKYDFLFMIGVLAHVNSLENTFSQVTNLLERDGTLIVQFTNRKNIISILMRFIFRIQNILGEEAVYDLNYTSFDKIKKELKKNSLKCYNKVTYWPVLPGFMLLSDSIRKFVYYNFLNSKILRPLGSEMLLFISLENEFIST